MRIQEFSLGDFEVYGICDGHFYLDGGAMFGVVPKVLWERKCPADKKNRIKLSLNSLLIKTKSMLVLVETGIGAKHDQKFSDIYAISHDPGLVPSLHQLGYQVEDIDVVINTHLHFDHCGGNTIKNDRGEIVPTFPQAQYFIQRGEWEDALHPNERDRASYLTENFLPLERFGNLRLVEGDAQISEGIDVLLAPGHTSCHQCVKIQSQGKTLLYLGDLVPTSAHVGIPYVMSYDLYPVESLKNKKKFYELALEENWVIAFVHDPVNYFGSIKKLNNKYEFQPFLA